MIIARTPFRISFCGGGTDFPDYYLANQGRVISTSIDKYIYITVNHKFDGKIHLRYADIECVENIDDLKHNIAREALKEADINGGVEIVIISDIPTQGSGLGSSSSLAVGLINALHAYKKYGLSREELARRACELEIEKLKSPIGKQDQYAAAMGDLNQITFKKDGSIEIAKVAGMHPNRKRLQWLKNSTMLFYLNGRSSNAILSEHKKSIENKITVLDQQKALTVAFLEWIYGRHDNAFLGRLITESWGWKKAMTPEASSGWIDHLIDSVLSSGALGAKLCGAGGGGFLMVICDQDYKQKIRKVLSGFLELKFDFDEKGTRIIYDDQV